MLTAYFSMAFVISWLGILFVTHFGGGRSLVFFAMLAGPATASIWLGGVRGLWAQRVRWRGPWPALLIAPVAMGAVLLGLSTLSADFAPAQPNLALALAGGLLAGFFEELGWTGFATPRLLARYGLVRGGVVLGLLWALWHALGDYWGTADFWGALWPAHFALWFVALTAYRLLMTWVYDRAHSLLFGMLMHATFTGSQLLLWPAAPPALELLWYGLYAAVLWAAVAAFVRRSEPVVTRPSSC